MRVTFVALTYAPSVGGAQTHVGRVAEGLAARGHTVRVVTTDALRSPGATNREIVEPAVEVIRGVTVHRFGTMGPLGHLSRQVRRALALAGLQKRPEPWARAVAEQFYGPFSVPMARAVRRAFRTDDVVVGIAAPFLTQVGPPFLRGRGRAAVVSMPLLHLEGGPANAAVAAALRRCDGVSASTGFERDHQVQLGVAPDRIAVLPPGVDPERFLDLEPAAARAALGLPERPTVGYLGRLAAYKGVDTLLEAAPALWDAHPDVTLLVAGSPSGWAGFDDALTAVRRCDEGRLELRTAYADDEKALLYAACDVVANPSREESFGLVALEAWAARRPVVAASIGAVRDVVRPGVDGLLVDPGDAAGLAAALSGLLDDEPARRAMGAAGRERAEGPLAWPSIVDGWDRFLAETVARRRRDLERSR